MKQWLSDNGVETDSLDKKAVAELLKNVPDKLASVLILRQQLTKSSVRKYQAMEKTVYADGRARGMFQFYGANRTGHFSGRNIQLQNLPQNHLPDLADASALVRSEDFDAVSLWYEDVPDILLQLIRTAFIPCDGTQFSSHLDMFSLEMFDNIAYIMAKHTDPSIPDSPEEWLDEFSTFSIYQVLPKIIELWGLNVQTDLESKKLHATDRPMITPLFLLRCVQLGISIRDLDLLTIGMVNDMYAESSNDEYKGYAQIATQKDFDSF